jgi:PAS domain S-box-containing protein
VLAVFVGCYLGSSLDTLLRFPHVGTAILFPPYAVLTAALLLSPPRIWWALLLAAALGNFLPHRATGPTSFVLLTEVANSARVLIAAAGIRRFGDPRGRIDTLRGMAAFLVFAAAVAPFAAAFIGAGVVALHGTFDRYWLVWRTWLLSNTLTALTLLPLTLLVPVKVRAWMRSVRGGRLAEAACLALALAVVGNYVFVGSHVGGMTLSARMYAPLPLLLWAAVRFGPGGTSASLLTIAVLAIWGSLSGRGPFISQSPAENLLDLQLFLIVVSLPILLLSALVREQRRTAWALRESRERYRSVVEDQTELICRFLPDGTLTFVNGAYCRYFQRPAEELVGNSFWPLIAPQAHDQARAFLASITPDRPVATLEHEVLAPAGDVRWQQWTDRGFFDEAGRIVDYQAVGRDVTERKRAEEEHRLLLTQREVAEALRQADRRKDEFLAMLGHELRNPLAPISTAVEILRRLPNANDQIRWVGDVVGRQVAHLKRLVDDLLDVSRITRGKIGLQMELLDLEHVVAHAVETSRPLFVARKHELTVNVSPGLRVRGDAIRLAQLLSNLLNNAAKFTNLGGRIALTAERDGEEAVLTVRDHGVGIPSEMLDRVFDLFTQVDGSRDRAPGGLGIGLTLVKRLVEMHGGSVVARSEGQGCGCEFAVRLPALPTSAGDPSARIASSGPRPTVADGPRSTGAARRVLVVDDMIDAAESLAHMLELQGHEVRVAYDGVAALDAADGFRPEIVFLDIGLPRVNGLEVARRLRARFGPQAMLIVATTGFGTQNDRRETTEAGFDHHLVKPIDPMVVRRLLATGTPVPEPAAHTASRRAPA